MGKGVSLTGAGKKGKERRVCPLGADKDVSSPSSPAPAGGRFPRFPLLRCVAFGAWAFELRRLKGGDGWHRDRFASTSGRGSTRSSGSASCRPSSCGSAPRARARFRPSRSARSGGRPPREKQEACTTDEHGWTPIGDDIFIRVYPCSSVVNSRCLEVVMSHPCCLALNVGLDLEGVRK